MKNRKRSCGSRESSSDIIPAHRAKTKRQKYERKDYLWDDTSRETFSGVRQRLYKQHIIKRNNKINFQQAKENHKS